MKLADALRDDFRFAHVNNADILAASGLEGKIVLQRPRAMKNKFEEGDVEYSQEKYTGKKANFDKKNDYNEGVKDSICILILLFLIQISLN